MSNNDNNKGNFNDDEDKGNSIGLGLIFGAALGLILGMTFDKLLFGITIGASLGLILGIIVDSNKK